MKARHIFLLILVAFSAVFYTLLFTQNAVFFIYFKRNILIEIFKWYHIVAWAFLIYGLESEKKSGKALGELLFIFVAVAIALVTICLFSSNARGNFGLDKEISLLIAFSTPIAMILYEIVYWISKRVFDHTFEFAGKFDLFKRPADWFLTMLIILGSFVPAFFLIFFDFF